MNRKLDPPSQPLHARAHAFREPNAAPASPCAILNNLASVIRPASTKSLRPQRGKQPNLWTLDCTCGPGLQTRSQHHQQILSRRCRRHRRHHDHQQARRRNLQDRATGPPPPSPPPPPTRDQIVTDAFSRSRKAIAIKLTKLRALEASINLAAGLDGDAKIIAIRSLGRTHARNIAVISKRLLVGDPMSTEFRSALRKAIDLIEQNSRVSSTNVDQGTTGRCDRTLPANEGKVPFASTSRTDADPRVSVCDPFFPTPPNPDLQRDVLTHEFFHLVGVADTKGVDTTEKALNNANTLAQTVAWVTDRTRQKNSDGNEAAVPPLPAP